MPVKKSAIKAFKKSKKLAISNKKVRDTIDFLIKKSRKEIEAKNFDSAKEFIAKVIKAIDKAAQKGILKKNTANRKKSRLIKKINRAQQ